MSEETTCCFTGHRPHRLPWHEDEWDPRCQRLREELDRTLYQDCIEALRRSARPRGEGE